ncbi:DUF2806 domain-containing protein [Oceanidesulfovibrio marinus]|nr:DUF2806 domain-containing protein [Oceanidesulfovibrio marinus]
MEFKDLLGAGKVINGVDKLLNTVGRGLGWVFDPTQQRRLAAAKADGIITEARAWAEAERILSKGPSAPFELFPSELLDQFDEGVRKLALRAGRRFQHQELKREANRTRIIQYAIDEIQNKKNISPEEVDEDWITNFFNQAQDVSNEQMQSLWGRILAGEVRNPSSFSFKTLNILKSISSKDANLFSKYASCMINNADIYIINNFYDYNEMLYLIDLELLNPVISSRCYYYKEQHLNEPLFLTIGTRVQMPSAIPTYYPLIVKFHAESPSQISIPSYVLSLSGRELSTLIETQPNQEYIHEVVATFKKQRVDVFTCATGYDNDGYLCCDFDALTQL